MKDTMKPCNTCNATVCYRDEVCGLCNGSGRTINYTIGLAHDGLVPAYVENICSNCGGHPYRRIYCAYY